ncbi:hypothetical protein AU077_01120 [Streptococcus gallolyticus]|uniref:hypothetical protein n=1 Tax=Streptococcus gallolyticus TaxID=315405 RepID=UPI000733A443|nr:hypothetical protein [Streptococcus gallolyticus]ALT80279.1 hypothetical protein AU077_01120 [Streptococcus gallolyticus]
MKNYILTPKLRTSYDGSIKPRRDISDILTSKLLFEKINYPMFNSQLTEFPDINNKVMDIVEPNSVIYFQYPLYITSDFQVDLIRKAHMNKCSVIAIVHDLNSLRGLHTTLERDIELLNQFDVITLPSKLAREVLTNNGLNVPVVNQTDPFDFLTNTPINYPTFSHTVNYAGNISFIKAGFLENINDVYMHIFGSNLDFTLPTNLEYMGQFDNDTLISKLNTGYGLLWDSDGIDNTKFKTYEKYNWQYKLSLYLASGIIPIADTNSNVGIWLNNNKCGLTLDILEELNNSIMAISKSQYGQLQSNVRIQQHRLREGYYTKELISSIEYELNKKF